MAISLLRELDSFFLAEPQPAFLYIVKGSAPWERWECVRVQRLKSYLGNRTRKKSHPQNAASCFKKSRSLGIYDENTEDTYQSCSRCVCGTSDTNTKRAACSIHHQKHDTPHNIKVQLAHCMHIRKHVITSIFAP